MNFVDNLTKEEYIDFFKKFKYSHFLQSYAWGETIGKTRGKKPCYVGLKNDKGKVVAAALLLKKSTPFGYSYYYCSRGYLIDFKDKELLKIFTEEIKKYLKRNKGIYVKINPEIMYQEIDEDGKRIKNGKNNKDIFDNLIELGYKHKGFVKLHENNEPRYSFRRYFEKYKSMDEIDSSISKTFMKTYKRSFTYDLEVNIDSNVDEFYKLNKANSEKNGFVQYSDEFYKTLYEYGKKYNNIQVINISVSPKKQYEKIRKEYETLSNQIKNNEIIKKNLADAKEKCNRYGKEIELFSQYKDIDNMTICSLINGIANDSMWTMYIGNNTLGEKLFAVNRAYYETIKYCFEHKFRFLDLYGTVGDPNTTYRNLGNLHQYKKKFGDTYIEFIGEFDLVAYPFLYKVLPLLLGIYRKLFLKTKKKL